MQTPAGRESWIASMVLAIGSTKTKYFRVHDSGNMFNVPYAQCWLEVCRMLPEVQFWIPTRAWQAPKSVLPVFDALLNVLRKLADLPNVTVRPSALNFGDHARKLRDCTRAVPQECLMCSARGNAQLLRKVASVAIAGHAGTPRTHRFRIAGIEGTGDTPGRPSRPNTDS